jgi:hypothetical protein
MGTRSGQIAPPQDRPSAPETPRLLPFGPWTHTRSTTAPTRTGSLALWHRGSSPRRVGAGEDGLRDPVGHGTQHGEQLVPKPSVGFPLIGECLGHRIYGYEFDIEVTHEPE